MIRRELKGNISEEQFTVVHELMRRLALFGYSPDEVIEHGLYHGCKVLERVAAGHEADAERAKRVAKAANAAG